MIIKALVDAYDRLAKNEDCEITRDGFCFDTITNFIVIDDDGNLKDIIVNPSEKTEKLLENAKKNTTEAWYLFDTMDYVLGLEQVGAGWNEAVDKSGRKKFDLFKNKNIDFLSDVDSKIARAIVKFLQNWQPSQNCENKVFYTDYATDKQKQRKLDKKCAFVLGDDLQKSYFDDEILKKWNKMLSEKTIEGEVSQCSVSGKIGFIAKNHKPIKLSGPQGKDAYLISVDKATTAYQTYNKQECYNSPISVETMQKYTSALTYFYRKGSKNKMRLGTDTMIFWAECDENTYEDDFCALLGFSPTKSEEEQTEEEVASAARQFKKGINVDVSDDMKFHILIISPNSARLTVRRYYKTTFGEIKNNVQKHYEDMALEDSRGNQNEQIPIRYILDATVSSVISQKREEAINPSFNAALLDSIFNDTIYPQEIFAQMIERIKTDNPNTEDNKRKAQIIGLTKKRTAFIKAYLMRKNRKNNIKEDIKMSLCKENKDEAYLLGRLFAVMEKAQQDAIPGANSTIKDRYFASASSTPAAVFPILLTGYQNHISKLEKGRIRYEVIVSEIMENFENPAISKQLNLDQQGNFIIGYYQQKNDLWKAKSNSNESEE